MSIEPKPDFQTYNIWYEACEYAEKAYFDMMECGCTPQECRSVLPNSLKTEIVMTANFREWRHIFKLRCAHTAHPQMREVMIPLMLEVRKKIPVIFDSIYYIRRFKIYGLKQKSFKANKSVL